MKPDAMILKEFIQSLPSEIEHWATQFPWHIVRDMSANVNSLLTALSDDFEIKNNIAIHNSAVVEEHVTLKGPIIISAGCFVGAHAYLRGGVYLGPHSSVGPGCEIKSSVITGHSALAHFNFIGDSFVGANVNMEAGSIVANHHNDRSDKSIHVIINGKRFAIDVIKFGALIGDGCKIGANAVLSPGTILEPGTIVKRLQLVQQS